MEQNESFCASDSGLQDEDSGEPSPAKRLKFPSGKVLEHDATEKLPQMVVNSDLLVFVAKCIQAFPDAWGVLLTTKHGKAGVASKFVKFLSNHPNPLTHGKTAATSTVSKMD